LISTARHLVSTFRFADLLDVLVVTVFIYFVLSWFQKRASRSVVIGSGSIVLLYLCARFLNMYMTSQVFGAGLTALLVILVIIFQDDIRMALERLSSFGIFHSRHRIPVAPGSVDSLIEAVKALANDKIGALIVLKGRDSLDRHLTAGTVVDGEISSGLLYSIFHPQTPSHDGAVIIESDRINQFGVHLPLSHNTLEIGNAGTRHTAALGLAERSDALVVAVSEERGTISLAQNGKLDKVNCEQFKNRIYSFYNTKVSQGSKIRQTGFPIRNPGTKFVSVVASVALWFLLVNRSEIVNRTITIPLEYRKVPDGWVMENPAPAEIKVSLSGPERAFNFDISELKASLEINNLENGFQAIPITESCLNIPSGLSVNGISPSNFTFDASEMVKIEVPVKVATKGNLADSLEIIELKAKPASIPLLVHAGQEKEIKEIFTEPLNLDNIDRDHTEKLELRLLPNARFSDEEHEWVEVDIKVHRVIKIILPDPTR